MTTATMGRRDLFTSGILVIAGVLAGRAILVNKLAVPGLGEVDTTSAHPLLKHGLNAVLTVHAAARDLASRDSDWFRRQQPCRDGRYRLLIPLDGKHWALWVLELVSPGMFVERTAFVTRAKYAKAVNDDCHGPGAALAYGGALWAEGRSGSDS